MKTMAAGLVLAATLLVGAPAQAGWGDGMGAWWLDGDDTPLGGNGVCATCLGGQGAGLQGLGVASGTGVGLALGFGDGTLPASQDGTGFGSPWTR